MDDEIRGVCGMKVLRRSNKFYSRAEWFRISELRIIDCVVFSDIKCVFFPH